ncbi:MAG: flap endonuclease-1 [Candidatus Thermoplasmatota archaeon]|nr:flap endonuclease-1 [Candidatus Thermoplasmatota archaeon]
MGVDISDIVVRSPTTLKEQKGSVVSVDAYNVIYQFLSNIRQADGTPLMDSNGRITSHISGLFFRTATFLQNDIKPVYVFDGKPGMLKQNTIEQRRLIREKNIADLAEAKASGDMERARSLSTRINYITREIVEESTHLLELMGVPYIMAPSEGEAQASILSRLGLVSGVVSQDYDCLLFGAKRVLRNFVTGGRRKIPGRNLYVNVSPELLDLEATLKKNAITQDQLISIGILVGTDFNSGLERVGAKTALNLIKKYGSIDAVLKARNAEIDHLDEIIDLFRNPPAIKDPVFKFNRPERDKLLKYLCDERSFSEQRVSSYVDEIISALTSSSQSTLESF